MATIFTHAVAASLATKTFVANKPKRFWLFIALCSVLPDADVIGFSYGIAYGDFWGHRGFTHSLIFAAITGFGISLIFFRSLPVFSKTFWSYSFWFFLATASHGVLDALTTGGLGIAFFSPFDNARYFFPWRPILVSPIGKGFFSSRGVAVLWHEILWVWLPLLVLCFLSFKIRRFRKRN